MIDFTSALYLGLCHGSQSLGPWKQLTLGKPAALAEPPGAAWVAARLAELQGCQRATLAPSTLHLFWELFGLLEVQGMSIHLDSGAYRVAQWGSERAQTRGLPVRRYPHHNMRVLEQQVRAGAARGLRPVVVGDGYCPGCRRPAPVPALLEIVRDAKGWLILDDTQSLGILGVDPDETLPLGRGGGGILRYYGVSGPEIVLINSLAKAFGSPLAVLSGSASVVAAYETASEVRVHASPPSVAVIQAAARAILLNHEHGDRLRTRLVRLVRRFQQGIHRLGLRLLTDPFPVQSIPHVPGIDAGDIQTFLSREGIQTILHETCLKDGPRVGIIITARHHAHDIDRAVEKLAVGFHRLNLRNPVWRSSDEHLSVYRN